MRIELLQNSCNELSSLKFIDNKIVDTAFSYFTTVFDEVRRQYVNCVPESQKVCENS